MTTPPAPIVPAALGAQATKHAAEPPNPRPITNHNDTHPTADLTGPVRRSPWPSRRCPACHGGLQGGPTLFRCDACARTLHAADIDRETHRPLVRMATGPDYAEGEQP
ncbi:hypothetical protein ACFY4C_41395 [Actinomadura viridis]|uniref:hypothetical protein n=1 Tax=Actinomadura viridis TaxID=58110 RepID=UPI0036910CA7